MGGHQHFPLLCLKYAQHSLPCYCFSHSPSEVKVSQNCLKKGKTKRQYGFELSVWKTAIVMSYTEKSKSSPPFSFTQ